MLPIFIKMNLKVNFFAIQWWKSVENQLIKSNLKKNNAKSWEDFFGLKVPCIKIIMNGIYGDVYRTKSDE